MAASYQYVYIDSCCQGRVLYLSFSSEDMHQSRFLFEHKAALGALAGMTAAQLGWSGRPVVSVTPDTCAMVALSLMADKAIAGLGVVSQTGALIGNFSYSDLRSALSPVVTARLGSALVRAWGGAVARKI